MLKRVLRVASAVFIIGIFSVSYIFRKDWEIMVIGYPLGPIRELNTTDPSFPLFVFVKLSRYMINEFCAWCLLLLCFPQKSTLALAINILALRLGLILPIYWVIRNVEISHLSFAKSFLHGLSLNPILMIALIPALWIQHNSVKV